ncbi:MAG: hypothetical protein AAF616_11315 [Bacteroidota bacterium]
MKNQVGRANFWPATSGTMEETEKEMLAIRKDRQGEEQRVEDRVRQGQLLAGASGTTEVVQTEKLARAKSIQ